MREKIIGTGIGLVLASLAVVGTFASQDGVNLLVDETATATNTPTDGTPTDTPEATATATETPDATATATSTPEATETPDGMETATPTATATAEPSATGTPSGATETPVPSATPGDDDEDGDAPRGIPSSNPVHTDDDGDGECEKHETVIKTTPSGNQVRVPCQAAKEGASGKSGKHHGHGNDE